MSQDRPLDRVISYHTQGAAFRGRFVRLETMAQTITAPQKVPEPVAGLLAEALGLGIILADAMTFEGAFTLQAQGDGMVPLLVVDVTSDGAVRGTVRLREDLTDVPSIGAGLLGKGHLAFTVDQGPDTDRYQGIVELRGPTLAAMAQGYFQQSEQIPTTVRLTAARTGADETWAAAGLMLQRMPDGPLGDDADDLWQTNRVLMDSVSDAEMLDPDLAPENLLHRLFHEQDLAVTREHPLHFACRCSESKVVATLAGFPEAEVRDMADDGDIEVTCSFCKQVYPVTLDTVLSAQRKVENQP